MASLKQLDAILFFIKKSTTLGAIINDKYIWNLYVERTPELQIGQLLFKDILEKLVKDGLIVKSSDEMYHLTVDGRNFKGYEHASKWYNQLSRKNIIEGVIYSLIVAFLIWAITQIRS